MKSKVKFYWFCQRHVRPARFRGGETDQTGARRQFPWGRWRSAPPPPPPLPDTPLREPVPAPTGGAPAPRSSPGAGAGLRCPGAEQPRSPSPPCPPAAASGEAGGRPALLLLPFGSGAEPLPGPGLGPVPPGSPGAAATSAGAGGAAAPRPARSPPPGRDPHRDPQRGAGSPGRCASQPLRALLGFLRPLPCAFVSTLSQLWIFSAGLERSGYRNRSASWVFSAVDSRVNV